MLFICKIDINPDVTRQVREGDVRGVAGRRGRGVLVQPQPASDQSQRGVQTHFSQLRSAVDRRAARGSARNNLACILSSFTKYRLLFVIGSILGTASTRKHS